MQKSIPFIIHKRQDPKRENLKIMCEKYIIIIILVLMLGGMQTSASAKSSDFSSIGSNTSVPWANKVNWSVWVRQLKQDAVINGVDAALFDRVFRGLVPDPRVIRLDNTQPEHRLSFIQYRKSRIDSYRILLGVKSFRKHQKILTEIGKHYGVDPCVITALWGIESSYGRYLGGFSVIRSLATLAYNDRRADFFRNELLIALQILAEGHVDYANFKGEWAGASGQPQFLPSSWQRYAVDYNGTGHKDIWTNYSNAFASIANYLVKNGWQTGQPWGVEATLPLGFSEDLLGLTQTKTVNEWLTLGVKPVYGAILPDDQLSASMIRPDGGPVFMAFKNFTVLMSYNNSTFYAASVGYLADKICKRLYTSEEGDIF